jgi:energy-coupling factor transporter ATP-binding protein EcfA2
VREVEALLDAGRSVLLVGPHGSGKSAVIRAVVRAGVMIEDPFAGVTTRRAATLRRALDRGAVLLGAASRLDAAALGHVGRFRWRLEHVYLRPLPPRAIAKIIRTSLVAAGVQVSPDRRWMAQAVSVAGGVPGRATALASRVALRWRQSATLLPPGMALAMAWQDDWIAYADHRNTTGRRPGESSS